MARQLAVMLTVTSVLVLAYPDVIGASLGVSTRGPPRKWLSRVSLSPKPNLYKTLPVESTKKTPVSTPVKRPGTFTVKHGLPGPPHVMDVNLRTTTRQSATTERVNLTKAHNGVTTGRVLFTTRHHDASTGRVPLTTGQPNGTTGRVPFTTEHHNGTTERVPFATGHHTGTTGRVPFTTGHHNGTTGRVPFTTGHQRETTRDSRNDVNHTELANTTNSPTDGSRVFYVCHDETEVNVTVLCDGHRDCPDGSDETAEVCQLLVDEDSCPTFFIACDNSTKCIHFTQLCDGITDCADHKDEKTCGFKCADGILHVPFSEVCDDKKDCWDGSDEMTWPGTNCSCSKFKCPTGTCIPLQQIASAGDECWGRTTPVKNNVERFCSRHNHFLCDNNTNCRPAGDRCDTFLDCKDGSDEMKTNVFGIPVCDCSSFVCSTGLCVPMNRTCDGVNDCGDLSDELMSECTPNRPRKCGTRFRTDPFHCGDGMCIEKMYKCDGNSDCLNGADEMYSTCYARHVCPEFTCSNGNCIVQSEVCNDVDNCNDFSDEMSCTKKNSDIYDDDDDDGIFDDNLGLYVALGVFCGVVIFLVFVAVTAAVVRRHVNRNTRIIRTREVRARVAYMTPEFVGPPSYSEAVSGSNVQRKTECSFVNPLSSGINSNN